MRLWRALASTPSDRRLHSLLREVDGLAPLDSEEGWAAVRAVMRDAAAAHRRRAGAALARSWTPPLLRPATCGGTLVIAFAGADANLGGGIQGGVPSHEFVASCRRAGVQHAIFVRDAMRAWYVRGLGGSGGSTFDGALELLRAEVAAVRPARLVTMGSSMGGYAAARAGIALGADAAVAFSPQVLVSPAARRDMSLPAAPFDSLLEGDAPPLRRPRSRRSVCPSGSPPLNSPPLPSLCRAERRPARSPPPPCAGLELACDAEGLHAASLVEAVREAPAGVRTLLEVHVGEDAPGDVAEAELLLEAVRERAGGSGEEDIRCEMTRHAGRDHNLVTDMRDTGELHELLCRVLAPPSTAASEGDSGEGIPHEFVGFAECSDF